MDYGLESVVRLESALLAATDRGIAGSPEVLFPRDLLNRMPPIYIADATGRFTLFSPEFEEFISTVFNVKRDDDGNLFAPEELLGIFRHLEKGVSEVKLRQTVQMGGETKHFRSFHVRTSEGGAENGTETGYAGIYTDVTLEAEAVIGAAQTEARFQDIIRSASDWVWETDVDLNLTYVSSRISETLEMPLGSLVERNIFALDICPRRFRKFKRRTARQARPCKRTISVPRTHLSYRRQS